MPLGDSTRSGVSRWPRISVWNTCWLPWGTDGPCVEVGSGDSGLWVTFIPYCFHVFCIWLKKCNKGWDSQSHGGSKCSGPFGFPYSLGAWCHEHLSKSQPQLFHYTWKPCSQSDAFKCKNLLLCSDSVNVNFCENAYKLWEQGPKCIYNDVMLWSCSRRKGTPASSLSISVKVQLVECLHTAYWSKKEEREER